MNDIETTVQKFVGAWNETDPTQRRRAVRELWRADGCHYMGSHDIEGHDALEERVTASNKRSVIDGGAIFRPATHIQTLPGLVKFRWDMAKRDTGEVLSAGIGILQIDPDRKIIADYLFAES